MAKATKGGGITAGTYRAKVKRKGKSRKKFGPKDQKPKSYQGQGR